MVGTSISGSVLCNSKFPILLLKSARRVADETISDKFTEPFRSVCLQFARCNLDQIVEVERGSDLDL